MKIYNISFDAVSITVVLEDNQKLFDFLLQSKDRNCKDIYVVGDKLYKKWSDDYSDECIITDLTDVRGIIHSESHVLPHVVGSAGKERKCYNCKHRTEAFKVGKSTHYHCMSPTYIKQYNEGIDISPWETLRVSSDTCDEHEFR